MSKEQRPVAESSPEGAPTTSRDEMIRAIACLYTQLPVEVAQDVQRKFYAYDASVADSVVPESAATPATISLALASETIHSMFLHEKIMERLKEVAGGEHVPASAQTAAPGSLFADVLSDLETWGISYCKDLADDGEAWEVIAEPEPQYFNTFAEAMKFFMSLKDEPELAAQPDNPKGGTTRKIDISNLRFYAKMAEKNSWQIEGFDSRIIPITLNEIADRLGPSPKAAESANLMSGLGTCDTPHFLGSVTEDRAALQQIPHHELPQNKCKNWKAAEQVVSSPPATCPDCGSNYPLKYLGKCSDAQLRNEPGHSWHSEPQTSSPHDELRAEWMHQTEWNDFTNWLVNVKIAALQAKLDDSLKIQWAEKQILIAEIAAHAATKRRVEELTAQNSTLEQLWKKAIGAPIQD